MKVYVLFSDNETIEGVFTTRKRAENAIDKLNAATGIGKQRLSIREFILDKIT